MKKSVKRSVMYVLIAIVLILAVFFVWKFSMKPSAESSGIANPASVYCINHGGKLDIRTDSSGGQYGMCTLANGTECEEWNYSRGLC